MTKLAFPHINSDTNQIRLWWNTHEMLRSQQSLANRWISKARTESNKEQRNNRINYYEWKTSKPKLEQKWKKKLNKQCKNLARMKHETVKNTLQKIATDLLAIYELHKT